MKTKSGKKAASDRRHFDIKIDRYSDGEYEVVLIGTERFCGNLDRVYLRRADAESRSEASELAREFRQDVLKKYPAATITMPRRAVTRK